MLWRNALYTAIAVACALVLVVLLSFPSVASAAGSVSSVAGTTVEESLKLDLSRDDVSVDWIPVRFVSVTTTPSSIRVGVDCGMQDMCGLNPCLCGSAVDQWGGCACNGLRTAKPALTFTTSDSGVVRVLRIGGAYLLCPTGAGRAVVTVRGQLVNYADAESTFDVHVTLVGLVMFYVVTVVFMAVIVGIVLVLVQVSRRMCARRRRTRTKVSLRGKDEG